MANYEIVGNEIRVNAVALTKKEAKAVKNLKNLFGYEIVPYTPEKKETNPLYKAKTIQDYLKANGTQEQIDTYWKIYNEPIYKNGKPVVYEKDTKTHKKGDQKVKGHVATFRWFKKEFPDYGK